jgi:hypothetical protein
VTKFLVAVAAAGVAALAFADEATIRRGVEEKRGGARVEGLCGGAFSIDRHHRLRHSRPERSFLGR